MLHLLVLWHAEIVVNIGVIIPLLIPNFPGWNNRRTYCFIGYNSTRKRAAVAAAFDQDFGCPIGVHIKYEWILNVCETETIILPDDHARGPFNDL